MNIKKLDLRVNFGIDPDFESALDAAVLSKRMTKTGYIRDAIINDLIKNGFLKTKAKGGAR